MNRKLATIEKILEIHPIKDADAIERAVIRGWNVVIRKNEFKEGDLVVYCEIDSIMPEREEFEFLRPKGFRIRSCKFRGQISQGIAFPLEILKSVGTIEPMIFKPKLVPMLLMHNKKGFTKIVEGEDVTDILGVEKYDPPMPACLGGIAKGRFPSHSIKTDEERIQNLTENFQAYHDNYTWIATEKLDGSSGTFFIYDNEFGIASRNLNLKENSDNEKNSFWKFARENDVEGKMRSYMADANLDALTLQGEIIGEGIQKNKYRIKGQTVKFFRLFIPIDYIFPPYLSSLETIKDMGLETVPIIETDITLPDTIEELLEYANGRSALRETAREGIVFVADQVIGGTDARPLKDYQGRLSFKVISNKFILKYD
ncbi:MAG: RNA ligase family protein [Promethearchaeota archaeon]